jgi:hypothetical protein
LDPETRAPFIGATKEDGEGRQQYRKGFGKDVSIEEGYSAMERARNKKTGKKFDQRRVNLDIARARGVEARTERMYEDQMVRQIMQEVDSRKTDERFQRDLNLSFERERMEERVLKQGLAGGNALNTEIQSIKPAPVQRSIAPDPWAQPGPGLKNNTIRSFGNYDQVSQSPELGGGTRRKRKSSYNFMSQPDTSTSSVEELIKGRLQERMKRGVDQMENIRTNPKYQRGRRIAYGVGGATALGSILGIGNDDEREERYQ